MREIVGYEMGDRITQALTATALWRAVRNQRSPAGLILHSDRGSQYGAHDYRQLLDQFEAAIQEYIEIFYNRQRRHSRLGYRASALFAENFKHAQVA